MTLRFAANVSILFTERPFMRRFDAAAKAGFPAVEFWWPEGEDLETLVRSVRDAGLAVALINFDGGDLAAGDRGLLNDPAREQRFRENVPVALELARALGCTRMNALVGVERDGVAREEQLRRAAANVAVAARAARPYGIQVLLEAISTGEHGPPLIQRTHQAAELLRLIGEPNVALQYDVFHMQRMEGNLAATIRRHIRDIAHVQIADCPGRGEPGTGEIRFEYLFELLDELGYNGYVGAEYQPTADTTEEGLGWLQLASAR